MPIKSLIGELPLKKKADILIANNMPRIAREAGIQGTELLSEQRGGETEPTTYEKERWELIKTHTERRTFISLLKLREWDSIKIKKFSGHKDIAMIDHYCKLEPSDYTDFQRLKRQHPEQVLQFTEDYRTDESTNTPNFPQVLQVWANDKEMDKVIDEMLQKGYVYDNYKIFPNKSQMLLTF